MKSKSLMFKTKPILVFLLTIFACTQVFAANYFVSPSGNDSDPGTQTQPWRTIGKAATTLVAGDTVYVQTGTYNETVTPVNSGTSGNIINYIAQGTVKVKNWSISSKNYITLDGFTNDITNYNLGNYAFFIRIVGTSSYITIQNFTLTVPQQTPPVSFPCLNESGIIQTYRTTSHITITGNNLSGSCYFPAVQLGGSHQIYSNNTIHDIYTDAFQGEGLTDSTISGNTVYNIYGIGYHSDFFQVFGDNGYVTARIIIENNTFRDSEDQLFFITADGIAGSSDITFRNNIWYNVAIAGGIGFPGVKFYNNVFWKAGWNTATAIDYNSNLSITMGAEVKNNFFIGCGNGTTPDYGTGYNRAYLQTTSSNNWYAKAPDNASPWGAQYFQTPEPNYVNGGNPLFIDHGNADFRLHSGSPAIDKGIAISPSFLDRDGTPRPQG